MKNEQKATFARPVIRCPKCGAPLMWRKLTEETGEYFCGECGGFIRESPRRTCPKCGQPMTWFRYGTLNGQGLWACNDKERCGHVL